MATTTGVGVYRWEPIDSSKWRDLTCVGSFHRKKQMAKTKKEVIKGPDGFYKGYDIKWLRKETSHPEHYLVAEYDSLEDSTEVIVEEPAEVIVEGIENETKEETGGDK